VEEQYLILHCQPVKFLIDFYTLFNIVFSGLLILSGLVGKELFCLLILGGAGKSNEYRFEDRWGCDHSRFSGGKAKIKTVPDFATCLIGQPRCTQSGHLILWDKLTDYPAAAS
jgi:hypothetical protein